MTAIWKTTHELYLFGGSFFSVGGRGALCARGVRKFYRIPPRTETIWLVLTNKSHRDALRLTHFWRHNDTVEINGARMDIYPWLSGEIAYYGNDKPIYLWIELEPTP